MQELKAYREYPTKKNKNVFYFRFFRFFLNVLKTDTTKIDLFVPSEIKKMNYNRNRYCY